MIFLTRIFMPIAESNKKRKKKFKLRTFLFYFFTEEKVGIHFENQRKLTYIFT